MTPIPKAKKAGTMSGPTKNLSRSFPKPTSALFARTYNATPAGNWEGNIILNRTGGPKLLDQEDETRLAACRAILLKHRAARVPPGFDDKVLADWNGLAISALADASRVFDQSDWLTAAQRAFRRIIELLWTGEFLHHSWRDGRAKHHATADGYANLIAAALALYAATDERSYLDWANSSRRLSSGIIGAKSAAASISRQTRRSELLVRPFSAHDDATPNANGVMIGNLARLAHLTGKTDYATRAERIHRTFAAEARNNPFGYASFMAGLLDLLDPIQLVLAGTAEHNALERAATNMLGPDPITQTISETRNLPISHPAHSKSVASRHLTYLCRGNVCAAPAHNAEELLAAAELLQLHRGVHPAA